MALSIEHSLHLNYDELADVLYASIGQPQPALSFEVETDILLRYIPRSRDVVGITIMNCLRHFPRPLAHAFSERFETHATNVVSDLLRKYPKIPV